MKDTGFYGISAACFLVLSYLFVTNKAPISAVMFLILAGVFAMRGFAKKV